MSSSTEVARMSKYDPLARWLRSQSGCAPGPGRPKGAKDRLPRGSVKAAWDRVMATKDGHESLDDAIRAGLKDRRQRLGFLELGARLNREIGPGTEIAGGRPHPPCRAHAGTRGAVRRRVARWARGGTPRTSSRFGCEAGDIVSQQVGAELNVNGCVLADRPQRTAVARVEPGEAFAFQRG